MADRVGDDLAGQVDLDRRVDRDHPAERADDVGVVGEVDRRASRPSGCRGRSRRAAACPSGTRSRSCRGCVPCAAPVTTPASTRSTTASVNISVWIPRSCLSRSAMRRRRRDRADAELERRAVRDEIGDVLADPALDVADRAGCACSYGGYVDLDREVDVVDVDEALAERPRHRPVELDDDRLRGADRRVHRLDADVPSEQNPWASGGVALTNTASSGSAPDSKRRGTSDRKTGT